MINNTIQPLQLTCDAQTTQVFNSIKGLKIDTLKLPSTTGIDVVIQDGWYKVSVGQNIYVAVYIDKSDPTYNYIIMIINIADVISICQNVSVQKQYKSGLPAPDNTIPQSTIDKAVSSFPAATTCGTGLWNGCTLNVPNKYIITGGALAGLYYFVVKK